MTTLGKVAAGIVAVAVLGTAVYLGITNLGQVPGGGQGDGGINVSGTNCDGIAAARESVNSELQERVDSANADYRESMEAASDTYWAERRSLDDARQACETQALLADPCKYLFERSSALAQEILDGIDDGFDEAKFQEREEVKKEYDECLQNPPYERTYEGMKAKCEADFAVGDAVAQATREATEAAATAARDAAIEVAEADHQSKHATLDAIEAACNVPPPTTSIGTGITTAGTGTIVQSGSPACTGRFAGYDPETQSEITRLQQLYNQARLAGKEKGIGGTESYAARISELRVEMAAGPRKCTVDSDCGDPEPVCCSDTEVGQIACSDGVCTAEKTQCEDDEICTGKPAQCVAPDTGVESQPISLSKHIVIGQSCSNRLQVLSLQPSSENSHRYEITGNVPQWLSFSHVGGQLPQDVEAATACTTLMGMGPGVYTGSATITVYSQENVLVNTIPLEVVVTVEQSTVVDDIDTAVSVGEDPVIEYPAEGTVSVGPSVIEFAYDHANPRCPLPITPITITGPEGSAWQLGNAPPTWLALPEGMQGTIPATIPLQFPCLLDSYKDQEQSTSLQFYIETPDGSEEALVTVNGSFTNF